MSEIVFFFIGAFLAFFIGVAAGEYRGEHLTMTEAGKRGHAVQCLGVKGWHWECPE